MFHDSEFLFFFFRFYCVKFQTNNDFKWKHRFRERLSIYILFLSFVLPIYCILFGHVPMCVWVYLLWLIWSSISIQFSQHFFYSLRFIFINNSVYAFRNEQFSYFFFLFIFCLCVCKACAMHIESVFFSSLPFFLWIFLFAVQFIFIYIFNK